MEKILTQEEITALVKGIEDGKVDVTGDKSAGSEAVPYDFSSQPRISGGDARLDRMRSFGLKSFQPIASWRYLKVRDVCTVFL